MSQPVELRDEVDWHRDPRTGDYWPKRFYTDIPLDGPEGAVDCKFVWELGRQQYAAELGLGWRTSHDAKFARHARRLILGWIEQNPLCEGIHWTSALEVAMRTVSWLWAFAALSDWDGWKPDDLARIAGSLCDHAGYLEKHLSFYSSPYNHLIGEATALLLIGELLNGSRDAARWFQLGVDVLSEHAPRQFYADGFSVEQATGYHYYTLGFLLQAVVLARRCDVSINGLEEVVHRACRAGMAMRPPKGHWPAIGDLDSARSMPVYPDDPWNFDGLCSLGAVMFDDPHLKPRASQPGEELYWLLGCDGVERWYQLDTGSDSLCHVLEDSGYAIARNNNDWLLFDAGPIAEGLHRDATPSTAHGHADTLQVLYVADGKELLIDSGMPFYHGSRRWIDHFRSPTAHNTLEVEGAPAARSAGPLDWSHVCRRPTLNANLTEEAWLMRGRANWPRGIVVERYVLGIPECGIWIADWIETDKPRRVRWYWQLPTQGVEIADAQWFADRQSDSRDFILASWTDRQCVRTEVTVSSEQAPEAWHAPAYGTLQPARRILRESAPVTELLSVSYIGRHLYPFEVIVRNRRLSCGGRSRFEQPDFRHQLPSGSRAVGEIQWRIETIRGLQTFVAGADLAGADRQEPDDRMSPLNGVGGWRAFGIGAATTGTK